MLFDKPLTYVITKRMTERFDHFDNLTQQHNHRINRRRKSFSQMGYRFDQNILSKDLRVESLSCAFRGRSKSP